jgi:predicted nuclease of predicted toxin-antitoxin system
MRFLADAGISPKTVEFLIQLGHESIHVRTLGLQRAPDVALVERARADNSVQRSNLLSFSPRRLKVVSAVAGGTDN